MPTPHAVTSTFLDQCRAVTPNPNGNGSVVIVLFPGVVLWPRVSESDAWAFGLASGITMSAATLSELQGATANSDGTFTNANGATRVLNLNAGACEPGNPVPPAP